MKAKLPINYTPDGSYLTFVKQTVFYDVVDGKEVSPKAMYECKCGGFIEAMINNVRQSKTKSCGCRRYHPDNHTKHGMSEHPLYTVWENMLTRCYNNKTRGYSRYGGRGVKMCEEWKNSPSAFISWGLKNGWAKGLQLDKDIKGNGLLYSPETCIFVTPKENSNKVCTNRVIEFNGVKKTMAQWADEYGIKHPTLHYRLKKHSIEDALNMKL